MTRFRGAPAKQGNIAMRRQLRDPSQLKIDFVFEIDLFPQPPAIFDKRIFSGAVPTDFKRIAEHAARLARHLAPNVDSFASICLFIFYRDHTFLSSLLTSSQISDR
jgi:hypothetical protein